MSPLRSKHPAPPGLSTSRAYTKKSRRHDTLSLGVGALGMLGLALVLEGYVGHDPRDDPITSIALIWLIILGAAVLFLALGLSSRDLVISAEGIQVPKPALHSMFRWGGIRKYSSVRKVEIARPGKSRHGKITLTFDDGYSGSLVSRDLVDAGLSKAQRERFIGFLSGLGTEEGRKGAVVFNEEK